ncbi:MULTISPECIES: DUF4865 family protein [unclassified Achromobacter]|uniref:DUF4865 family protein n=1 Tax=unclassified Achromobacter TaxID=2626865 RepID=UPI000B518815|nr:MULTISPECIES: DUF4865 family protein [unclassified Achromobacter]OWT80186.1 DUF4865 domain-containing protein [Achromobacter sp. HZ34]OWT82069.1 DUF4865 domain-containing protein [Achromobacter sp. HZ28]
MLIAHYTHRLPADYDLGIIRRRAAERGTLWDATPRLYFKGFLLREAGQLGAISHSYSSLYLWQDDQGLRDFLLENRYKTVTDSFGRANIDTRIVLDARRGTGQQARYVQKEEVDIPLDQDLGAAYALEVARNRAVAAENGVIAATVGVDTAAWRITRVVVREANERAAKDAVTYEVLHLARPLLDQLPLAVR